MHTSSSSLRVRHFGIALLSVGLVVSLIAAWWVEHRRLTDVRDAAVDVYGAVTLDGLPLSDSRVYFTHEAGHFIGAEIVDGEFQIPELPVGDWSVRMEGESVPPLYSTGMTATVTPSQHEFRFGLKGHEALAALASSRQP